MATTYGFLYENEGPEHLAGGRTKNRKIADSEIGRHLNEAIQSILQNTIGFQFRVLHGITGFVLLTLVAIFTGIISENSKVHHPCTMSVRWDSTDGCLNGSHYLRPFQLTAETNALVFEALPTDVFTLHDQMMEPGSYRNTIPLSTQHEADRDTLMNATDGPAMYFSHLASTCMGSEAAVEACKLSRIQDMFLAVNDKRSASLKGGIHIWFMLWFGLHLSVLFHLYWSPTLSGERWLGMNYVRGTMIVVWFLWGLLFPVLLVSLDHIFNLRVPVSNMVLSWVVQVYVFLVFYQWYTDAKFSAEEDAIALAAKVPGFQMDAPSVTASVEVAHPEQSTLSSLMRIGAPGRGQLQSGKHRAHEVLHHLFARDTHDSVLSKQRRRETVEMLAYQLALTMPPFVMAVWCMLHRNVIDWQAQSMFVRTFVVFIMYAFCARVAALCHTRIGCKDMYFMSETVLSVSWVATLMGFTVWHDIMFPEINDVPENAHLSNAHTTSVFFAVAFAVILLSFFVFFTVVAFDHSKLTFDTPSVSTMSKWMYGFVNFAMLFIQIYMLVMFVSPKSWYGLRDMRDVAVNYH